MLLWIDARFLDHLATAHMGIDNYISALAPSTHQHSETWPDLANLAVNPLCPPGASVRPLQEWLSLSLNLYGIAGIRLQAFSAPHWLVEHHLFPGYISSHTAEAPNPEIAVFAQ